MELGVLGPCTGAGDPSARVVGGCGGLAVWPEPTEAVEVPDGEEVPPAGAPEVASTGGGSPWGETTPPPRSMKSERSFFSRDWMSSGLLWHSVEASHLGRNAIELRNQFMFCSTAPRGKKNSPRVTFPAVSVCLPGQCGDLRL